MIRYFICAFWLLVAATAYSQCSSNVFLNGEMDGAINYASTAPGWSEVGDPDIQDHDSGVQSLGFEWYAPVFPSSDSSTWQNLFGFERIFQNVTLQKGALYSISFEYASQPLIQAIPDATLVLPIELRPTIWFDDVEVFEGATTQIVSNWYHDCFLFRADKEEMEIKFGHKENGYIAFDNICLMRVEDEIAIDDQTLCLGDAFTLSFDNDLDLVWNDSDTVHNKVIEDAGEYWVDVRHQCGNYREEFQVVSQDCDCKLYIPNSFIPNQSGSNDSFKLASKCDLAEFELIVYDKWGSKIFVSYDITNSWSGRVGSSSEPTAGVFAYSVKYRFLNEEKLVTGSIQLIR